MGIAWQTSRLKCKLAKSQEQLEQERKDAIALEVARVTAAATTSNAISKTSGKVAFNTTVNQVSDEVVDKMSVEAIATAFEKYHAIYKGPPPEGEEPSEEQIAATKALIDTLRPPTGDYAILRPYPYRHIRNHIFSGLVLMAGEVEGR